MKDVTVRKRFVAALAFFSLLIIALWFGYQFIAYRSVSRSAHENAELAALRLLDRVSAEFSQMRSIGNIIASSPYVQDFLAAETVEAHFARAEIAAEIIRNAASPVLSADNVITFDSDGVFFRFSGGLSNAASASLFEYVNTMGTFHTVMELDGVLFFCHSTPVYSVLGHGTHRVGTAVILVNLNRKRAALTDTAMSGLDTAFIQNGTVLLSGAIEFEGQPCTALDNAYVMVVRREIESANLSIAAAVRREVLMPNRPLFFITSGSLLLLLLTIVALLYYYLSFYMIKPMSDVIGNVSALGGEIKDRLPEIPGKPDFQSLVFTINDMLDRIERYHFHSLITQMDTHFVVNALMGVKALQHNGENEKAERMAEGLTQLIKQRHKGDVLCNLFSELEMIGQYVNVMNIRHDNKFAFEYDVDDALAAYLIPGLIIQPIVENALTHGLLNKKGDAVLHIRGSLDDENILLEISDNGVGIPPKKMESIEINLRNPAESGFSETGLSGVSLPNIQRRIFLRFGAGYGLTVKSALNEGTTVNIVIPAKPDV
ncbi:MAG: histidine kinase [Defluviitaleaceae bacterium]|nr:histidine kinase [Defluviitaleaceae bacterium]